MYGLQLLKIKQSQQKCNINLLMILLARLYLQSLNTLISKYKKKFTIIHQKYNALLPQFSIHDIKNVRNLLFQNQFIQNKNIKQHISQESELDQADIDFRMNYKIQSRFGKNEGKELLLKNDIRKVKQSARPFKNIFLHKDVFQTSNRNLKTKKQYPLVELYEQSYHTEQESKFALIEQLRAKKQAEQVKNRSEYLENRKHCLKKKIIEDKYRSNKGKQKPAQLTYDFEGGQIEISKVDPQKMSPLIYQCTHNICEVQQLRSSQRKLKNLSKVNLLKSTEINNLDNNQEVFKLDQIQPNQGVKIKYKGKIKVGLQKKSSDPSFLIKNSSQNEYNKKNTIQMADYLKFTKTTRVIIDGNSNSNQNQLQEINKNLKQKQQQQTPMRLQKKLSLKRQDVKMQQHFKAFFSSNQITQSQTKKSAYQNYQEKKGNSLNPSINDIFNITISNKKDWGQLYKISTKSNSVSYKQLKVSSSVFSHNKRSKFG